MSVYKALSKNMMKNTRTRTDREVSLRADEFIWDTESSTEAHIFIEPVLREWLITSKGVQLLDLGCGNGSLTSKLSQMGLLCTGTDYSESGLQIARKLNPEVTFFQSTLEHPLPIEQKNKYDVVVATEVIEHLLLPRQLFARASEALKAGGTLIVTTPYHGYWKNVALALFNKYDYHWHPLRDYGHVKFFSINTLSELFEEQGYRILSIKRVGRVPVLARSVMIKAVKKQ